MEMSSHHLIARRVELRWLLAALRISAGGVLGVLFADPASLAGTISPFLAGLGFLTFITLLRERWEQDRQAERYGTPIDPD